MYQLQNQKPHCNDGLLLVVVILLCFFCTVALHDWFYIRPLVESSEIGVGTDVGSQVVIGTFATVNSVEGQIAAVRPTDVFTATFQRYGIGVSGDLFMLPLAAVTEVSPIPQLPLPSNEISGHSNTLRQGDTVICIFSGIVTRVDGSFVFVRPQSTFGINGGSSPIRIPGTVSEDNLIVALSTLLRIDPNDPFPVPDPHRPRIHLLSSSTRERRPNPFLYSDAGSSQPNVGLATFPLLPSSREPEPNVLPQDPGPSQPSFGGGMTLLRPPSPQNEERPNVLSPRERHEAEMMNLPLPRAPIHGISSDWYYWDMIQKDPWYTTYRCEAPDECAGDHRCTEGYYMFHRRLVPRLRSQSIVETRVFRNEYTAEPRISDAFGPVNTAGVFLDYVYFLIRNPAIRLWSISVTPDHSFIIEQQESDFRVYQSWADSFDLRYWTDPFLAGDLLCEPCAEVRESQMHPGGGNSEFLARAGVQDDTESIIYARTHYGGLTTLGSRAIRRIFQSLTDGFFLEYRLLTDPGNGMDVLFPAEMSFTGSGDTRPLLGKHVIDLRKLFAMRRFEIEVTFIQDNRKQEVDESFVDLLRDMRVASEHVGSSSNVDTNEAAVGQKGTCSIRECESCPSTDEEIHRRRMTNDVHGTSLMELRHEQMQIRVNRRFRAQNKAEEADICSGCCERITRFNGLQAL